mmetsp:Transcript_9740/g.23582  ORF Transcript_9740/g.23582 Transcript_9740/m.23582 type:complete len:912 (-) Transcript_9740:50-2785(-)
MTDTSDLDLDTGDPPPTTGVSANGADADAPTPTPTPETETESKVADDENETTTTTSSDDDEIPVGTEAPTDSGVAEQPTDEERSSARGSSEDWPDDEVPTRAADQPDSTNETPETTEDSPASEDASPDATDAQEETPDPEQDNGIVAREEQADPEEVAEAEPVTEEEEQPEEEPEAAADNETDPVTEEEEEPEATADTEDAVAEAAADPGSVPEEVESQKQQQTQVEKGNTAALDATEAETNPKLEDSKPSTEDLSEATLPSPSVRPGLAEAPTDEINPPFGTQNTDTPNDSTDKASNVDNSFSELEDPQDTSPSDQEDEPRPPTPPAEPLLSPKPEPVLSKVTTPRSGGLSFAEAFGGKPKRTTPRATQSPSLMALKSPGDLSVSSLSESQTSLSIPELGHTASSHSALSASRNRKASGLISKYQEKVAHEPKPGDSMPIRSSSTHSRSGSFSMHSAHSSAPEQIMKQSIDTESVESEHLPDMKSVRAMFEKTAQNSTKNFEFGESFRQKQRFDQLSDKQRGEEAKVLMRGFNEKDLNEGRTASAEIDTSNLPKSFTFEMCSPTGIVPNDGVCRVDYKAADYFAKVFVLHKTKGMLLLRTKTPRPSSKGGSSRKTKTVPGGLIQEEEFLAAAKQSGSASVQLQIAAREAAARQLYETTGLDVRQQADRFKPAVLCANPKTKTTRGFQYLRNENDNKLYYFLSVDDDDFEELKKAHAADASGSTTKLTRPTVDSGDDSEQPEKSKSKKKSKKRRSQDAGDDPLELRLSSDYSSFEFIQDPSIASKVLKKDKSDASTALHMIMNSASHEMKSGSDLSSAADVPDAKATVHLRKSSTDDDENDEILPNNGNVRTVGIPEDNKDATTSTGVESKSTDAKIQNANAFYNEEAKLNTKTSNDTADVVAVSCCCSFW